MRRHILLSGSIITALSLPPTPGAQRGSVSDTVTRARGPVTGFDVTDGRMRHVKFVKRKST